VRRRARAGDGGWAGPAPRPGARGRGGRLGRARQRRPKVEPKSGGAAFTTIFSCPAHRTRRSAQPPRHERAARAGQVVLCALGQHFWAAAAPDTQDLTGALDEAVWEVLPRAPAPFPPY